MKQKLKIMIVAGEASGDAHGAKLVRELRQLTNGHDLELFGAAGHQLREAGVEAIVDADHLSIVGLLEIGRALPMFIRAFRRLKNAAKQRHPDAVILVDFPDFNLKLARSLKKSGNTVVYYISPQLWAWRKYRIASIRRYVDLMIAILPFEKEWYGRHGLTHVEYVGSPLAREVHSNVAKPEFCQKHGLDPMKPIVALLPGSRHKEIARILPIMLEATWLLATRSYPEIQIAIGLARVRSLEEVESAQRRLNSDGMKLSGIERLVKDETYDLLNASDAAAITSGTATLEAGIIGTPMAIVYKTSPLNYKLLRPLISVEHFGLINLIAGRRVANELIQDDLTPESLASEMERILAPVENSRIRKELKEAADKLGHGGASKRAAAAILELIGK